MYENISANCNYKLKNELEEFLITCVEHIIGIGWEPVDLIGNVSKKDYDDGSTSFYYKNVEILKISKMKSRFDGTSLFDYYIYYEILYCIKDK